MVLYKYIILQDQFTEKGVKITHTKLLPITLSLLHQS